MNLERKKGKMELYHRAVTSIPSQRLPHKMTNSRPVFIARIHININQDRANDYEVVQVRR